MNSPKEGIIEESTGSTPDSTCSSSTTNHENGKLATARYLGVETNKQFRDSSPILDFYGLLFTKGKGAQILNL